MPFSSKGSQLRPSSGAASRPSTFWPLRWRSSSSWPAAAGEEAERMVRIAFIMAVVTAWSAGLVSE